MTIEYGGFQLLDDKILVISEQNTKTNGGLYIPDQAKERPDRGIVIRVGPGKIENGERVELPIKENDRVIYYKHAGTEIDINGEKLLVLSPCDIFGFFPSVKSV